MSPLRRSRAVLSRLASTFDDVWATSLLLVLAVACALILLSLPRPVAPNETPGLRLPAGEIEQVLQQDSAATRAMAESAQVKHLEKLFLQKGRSEANPRSSPRFSARQLAQLRGLFDGFRQRQGETAVRALRARAVARLESALRLELSAEQIKGVLGSFPVVLQQHGATRDGELVAPPFVIRTMYKCRWNMIHGLGPTRYLSRVELLAYWGWLALYVGDAPVERRLAALQRYASLGGANAAEAGGVLYYLAGDFDKSARHLQAAYRQRRSLRLRNHLLAAQIAGGD